MKHLYSPLPLFIYLFTSNSLQKRELKWLLEAILPAPLQSMQDGLTECISLLDPQEDGSTLALSSLRSEALKGFVVRMGERITKGELLIRLRGLGNSRKGYNISIADQGIYLQQVHTYLPLKHFLTRSSILRTISLKLLIYSKTHSMKSMH